MQLSTHVLPRTVIQTNTQLSTHVLPRTAIQTNTQLSTHVLPRTVIQTNTQLSTHVFPCTAIQTNTLLSTHVLPRTVIQTNSLRCTCAAYTQLAEVVLRSCVQGWPEPYIYKVYVRYFWQGHHQIWSYTVYIYSSGQPYS